MPNIGKGLMRMRKNESFLYWALTASYYQLNTSTDNQHFDQVHKSTGVSPYHSRNCRQKTVKYLCKNEYKHDDFYVNALCIIVVKSDVMYKLFTKKLTKLFTRYRLRSNSLLRKLNNSSNKHVSKQVTNSLNNMESSSRQS